MSAIDFHSEIASEFSEKYNYSEDFMERYKVWVRFLDKYLVSSDIVLDAGCGSGIFSFYAAQKAKRILGIDGSKEMIDICFEKLKKTGMSNMLFQIRKIPMELPDNQYFNTILSSSVLEYLPNFNEVCSRLADVMFQGGTLIFSLPNSSSFYRKIEKLTYILFKRPKYLKFVHNSLDREKVIKELQLIGFQFIESEYFANTYLFSGIVRFIFGKEYSCNMVIYVFKKL